MGGQIIDATVVPAPKQRNNDEEKAAIKQGKIPERWKEKPAKIRQKDRDARWSLKYTKAKVKEGADPKGFKPVDLAIPMFGYKNHIGIDRAHGLIRTWDASAANAHDGARLPELISKQNTGSGCGRTLHIARRRTRRSSSGACSRAISTSGACRGDRCPSTSPEPMPGALLFARQSSTCSPNRSTVWGCLSAPSASPVQGSRSAWRTSPITSSASPGSRGEVRPHSAKAGCRAALQSRNPRNQARDAAPHGPKAVIRPLAPPSDKNSRFFEVSIFLPWHAGRSGNSPGLRTQRQMQTEAFQNVGIGRDPSFRWPGG